MIGNRVYGSKREGIYRKLRPINHPAQEFADPHALCLSWQVSPWPVRCSDGRTHECGPSPSHPATPEQPRFSPDKKVLLQETSQAAAGTRPWRRLPPQGRPLWPKRDKLVWLYYCMVVLSCEYKRACMATDQNLLLILYDQNRRRRKRRCATNLLDLLAGNDRTRYHGNGSNLRQRGVHFFRSLLRRLNVHLCRICECGQPCDITSRLSREYSSGKSAAAPEAPDIAPAVVPAAVGTHSWHRRLRRERLF